MVVAILSYGLNLGADVGAPIVVVVPQQVAGQPNFPCRMAGRFVAQIWLANVGCQIA